MFGKQQAKMLITGNDHPWSLQAFHDCLPLQSIETFHHSKTFRANLGVNPLVASAAPLFTLIAKLRKANGYNDLNKLQRELIFEVRAFECNALASHYHPNIIIAARYAIVVALDETILRTEWGQSQLWKNYGLTGFFYRDNSQQTFFFSFLEMLLGHEKTPVDLLEFCYLSLNLAFSGLHQRSANEHQQTQMLIDKLYYRIKRQKKQPHNPLNNQIKTSLTKQSAAHLPVWLLAAAGVMLSISIYFGFNYLASSSTQPLYAKLDHIIENTYEKLG